MSGDIWDVAEVLYQEYKQLKDRVTALVAENAALEAQAVRDAKVVNAAAGVEANAMLDDNYDDPDHYYFTVPRHFMYALRAALTEAE